MQQAEHNRDLPLNAFQQLALKIRSSKYKLTPEEERLLTDCNNEAKTAGLRGCLLGAAVAWGLTRRAKVSTSQVDGLQRLLTRVIFCFGSGISLGTLNVGRIEGRCAERLTFLDGSPLQGELIAILEKDYPNAELLKKYLKHRSTREVTYDPEGNIVLQRLPAAGQDLGLHEHGVSQDENRSAGSQSLADPQAAAASTAAQGNMSPTGRRWQDNDRQDSDSMFINFFEFYTGNDGEDSNNPESSKPKDGMERRRSRMTPEERRVYNKQQYLARKHQQVTEREAVF